MRSLNCLNEEEKNQGLLGLQKSLKNLKLTAHILAELLTINENLISYELNLNNVKYFQSDSAIFENTSSLLILVHQKNFKVDLKCELLRLMGILVFENKENQNKIVDNKVIHILSDNFYFDNLNIFSREWSIISLKHVLDCHDYN
jgi:hypothetical protein